jgi:excisionase family DNA binding protein
MTLNQLRAKLEAQAEEFDRLGAMVPASKLCRSILHDLEMIGAEAWEILSMQEASQYSGYSEDHLARLVKQGKLPTLRPAGSRVRYAFRRGDLPQKPGGQHTSNAGVHDLASRLSTPRGKEAHHGRS